MQKKFKHTGFRMIAAAMILAVFSLNIPQFIHCSMIMAEDDCCHVQNTIKPCCVKNVKLIASERITGHCGCSYKETQLPSDLYTDILKSSSAKENRISALSVLPNSVLVYESITYTSVYYSPPDNKPVSICISNLNLRI